MKPVEPAEYRVLAPLVIREMVYRLLTAQGSRLHLATFGGHTHRMVRAVEKPRENFNKPLRIEEVARELGMSVSGFHAHFRAVTAMSPLQFQEQLRLQEARRLMLSEAVDAAEAGYRVGYDDPLGLQPLSREYKRHFAQPPIRDVERLRQHVALAYRFTAGTRRRGGERDAAVRGRPRRDLADRRYEHVSGGGL